jgi:hypothetical protein
VVAITAIHFLTPDDKKTTSTKTVATAIMTPNSNTPPAQAITPAATPAPQATIPETQVPDKMQVIERIASEFHKSHTYTLRGGFVCLDMAIDIWNQLETNGIEAKIMGGNVNENVTTWNYRQLVTESNHAWVVAKLSPTEKVAIETTEGIVIKPGMKNASAYFRGIEFDTPEQIKKFEFLMTKAKEVCREAYQMINDSNENIADKQLHPEEIIAKKSRIEQRKQDCERTLGDLKEFESRAIYY